MDHLNHIDLGHLLRTGSLQEQFRALFGLKNLGTDEAVDAIASGFGTESVLLKHELAYVLGQMRNPRVTGLLTDILDNPNEDPMVRHEAGEALGAIGCLSSLPILEKYKSDPLSVISETCQLALERIHRLHNPDHFDHKALVRGPSSELYLSIDPSPPETKYPDVEELGKRLMDQELPLFERYKAMFGLRNNSSKDAVLELTKGLEDPSPLFRHEIAYVLGQVRHPASIDALYSGLKNDSTEMVRHECAEALGSIASEEAMSILKEFVNDESVVVRESCVVALDIGDHENSAELEYVPKLQAV